MPNSMLRLEAAAASRARQCRHSHSVIIFVSFSASVSDSQHFQVVAALQVKDQLTALIYMQK